jgi:hypothetical protein
VYNLPENVRTLYWEYVVAENAREAVYDEMLTRRGDYIELYGLDPNTTEGQELIDAIDQTDTEFWQWHDIVNQRYSNAALALGQALHMSEQELLRAFNVRYGVHKDMAAEIDWERQGNVGLYAA